MNILKARVKYAPAALAAHYAARRARSRNMPRQKALANMHGRGAANLMQRNERICQYVAPAAILAAIFYISMYRRHHSRRLCENQ